MVKRYDCLWEYGMCIEDDGEWVSYDDYEALQAEIERLKEKVAVTMGVGSGGGNSFVHGDYDSIKVLQDKLLEMDRLRSENERLKAERVDLMQMRKTVADAMNFIAHFSWAWNGTGQHPNTIRTDLQSLLALIDGQASKGEGE